VRPKLAAAWRLEPNLTAQVSMGDTSLVVAGAKVNVPAQVKPLIDKTVGEQIAAAGARIRNDPSIERNARIQWAKACRSIPLQSVGGAASVDVHALAERVQGAARLDDGPLLRAGVVAGVHLDGREVGAVRSPDVGAQSLVAGDRPGGTRAATAATRAS